MSCGLHYVACSGPLISWDDYSNILKSLDIQKKFLTILIENTSAILDIGGITHNHVLEQEHIESVQDL